MEDEAIPEDIKARAQEFVAWLLSSASGDADPTDALAAALLAERAAERARVSRIAAEIAAQFINGPATTVYGQGWQRACAAIDAAIRAQP